MAAIDDITGEFPDAAIRAHPISGPGLLES
jgi:hypothetical protein